MKMGDCLTLDHVLVRASRGVARSSGLAMSSWKGQLTERVALPCPRKGPCQMSNASHQEQIPCKKGQRECTCTCSIGMHEQWRWGSSTTLTHGNENDDAGQFGGKQIKGREGEREGRREKREQTQQQGRREGIEREREREPKKIERVTCMHICCRVENPSKIWGFLRWKSVQGCVENPSKILFCLFFPQFYSGFCWSKKTQIVCRGAKIIFWQFLRVSKKGFSKKDVHFLFLSFYVGTSKKDNMRKVERKISQKKTQKNSVFWVVVKKNAFL